MTTLLSQAKVCPFCHGHGERDTYGLWFWSKAVPGKIAVACSNPDCSATGPLGTSKADAVTKWNTAPRHLGYSSPAVRRVLDEAVDTEAAERELDPGGG